MCTTPLIISHSLPTCTPQARSLFGGGGPAPNLEDDEEEVEIHQEIVSDDQNEDGEEAQVDVYDESEGEYVEEEYSEEDGDDSHSH